MADGVLPILAQGSFRQEILFDTDMSPSLYDRTNNFDGIASERSYKRRVDSSTIPLSQ
jgi:hypothetical protein